MTWLSGYNNRKKITIDHLQVSASLSYFPVLIKIESDSDIGAISRADGIDLCFTDIDGNILKYERESFSINNGACTATFWVQIISLSDSADTDIYLYYGNPTTTDHQNKTGVWDDGGNNNFNCVWHLGNGSTLTAADSTSGGCDGIITGATATSGKISGAALNGITDKYIDFPSTMPRLSSNQTISMWIKPNTVTPILTASSVLLDWSPYQRNVLINQRNASIRLSVGDGGTNQDDLYTGNVLSAGQWAYLVTVIDGTTHTIYVDAVSTQAVGSWSGGVTSNTRVLGSDATRTAESGFDGSFDEVRISNISRDSDWISTEYANQSSQPDFVTYGVEELITNPYADWSNKDVHIIHDTVGAGHQFPFTLSWKTGMNSDFSDLRITDESYTIIPYWIESKTDGVTATVWIKPTESSKLYIFYGNSQASTLSSGEVVFDFFDGAESGSLTSKWSINGNSTYATYSTDRAVTGSKAIKLDSVNGGAITIDTSAISALSYILELWMYDDGDTDNHQSITLSGSASRSLGIWTGNSTTNYSYMTDTWRTTDVVRSVGWHKINFVLEVIGNSTANGGNARKVSAYIDDNLIFTSNEDLVSTQVLRLNSGYTSYVGVAYYDNIRVRKHIITTPTVTEVTSGTWAHTDTYLINDHPGSGYVYTIPALEHIEGMNNDFSDLRFKDYSDVSLPYWIESKTDGVTAKVHIRLTASSILKILYGNPTACSESNGDSVFDFFDGAESDAISNKWVSTLGTWNYNTYSPEKQLSGTRSICLDSFSSAQAIKRTLPLTDNYILELSMYDDVNDNVLHQKATLGSESGGVGLSVGIYTVTSNNYYLYFPSGSWTATSVARTTGWHNIKYTVISGVASAYLDGSLIETHAASTNDLTLLSGYSNCTGLTYFDNVRLKKYTTANPTLTPLADWSSNDTYIVIDHPGAGYQACFDLSYKAGMNADFSDLRIFDGTGCAVPYWIESKTDGITAKVWVKLTSDSSLLLYYANSSATSVSSGASVFETFDEFTTWNSAIWGTEPSQITLTDGVLHWDSTVDDVSTFQSAVSYPQGYVAAYRFATPTPPTGYADVAVGWCEGTNVFLSARIYRSASDAALQTNGGGGINNGSFTPSPTLDTNYHILEVARISDNEVRGYWDGSEAISTSSIRTGSLGLYLGSFKAASFVLDWVYVRKYTETEPTIEPASGSASLSTTATGSGSATANIKVPIHISSTSTGSGSYTVTPKIKIFISVNATGSGSSTVAPKIKTFISTNVTGSGSYTVTPISKCFISATGTGSGTATATAHIATTSMNLSSTVTGSGSYTVTPKIKTFISTTCTGSGSYTVTPASKVFVSVNANGSGSYTVTPIIKTFISTNVTGSGSYTVAPKIKTFISTNVTGIGSYTATPTKINYSANLSATATGSGSYTARIKVPIYISTSCTGTGSTTANAKVSTFISATATGSGTSIATETLLQKIASSVSATGSATAIIALYDYITGVGNGTGLSTATIRLIDKLRTTATGSGSYTARIKVPVSISTTATGSGSYTANAEAMNTSQVPLRTTATGTGTSTAVLVVGANFDRPLTVSIAIPTRTAVIYQ